MKLRIVLLQTILTVLFAVHSRGQDFEGEMSKLLMNSEKIKGYDVRVSLIRTLPQEIELALRFLETDDMWRMDKTWKKFSLQREREGEHHRLAIVGDTARFVDSKMRPELDFAAKYEDEYVDLRLLGGSTSPFLNHDDSEVRTIITRMLMSKIVESKSTEEVNALPCLKWTKALEDGQCLSVFFDKEMIYRGCEFKFKNRKTRTWIETWGSDDGILFPTKVTIEGWDDMVAVFREEIVVESLDLNPSLSEKDFSFAALGIRDGEVIVDRTKKPSKLGK